MDWLLTPIDPGRAHLVDTAIAWHARLMVLSWGILLPLGVLIARFFKVMPRQNWPERLDNRFWWLSHLGLQYMGGGLMLAAFALLAGAQGLKGLATPHAVFGYAALALGLGQIVGGWLRGTKGGPGEASLRGDHYDMTPRRVAFEYLHKSLGYLALALSVGAILSGLWQANGPRWMWLVLALWWSLWLIAFIGFQRQGRAFDTYQAIWGPSPDHPGNRRPPIGWGVTRNMTTGGGQP